MGKVFLVGAGPGDPELITIKAQKTIQQADVVLYDSLVSDALLQTIPRHVKLIHCGKEKYSADTRQEKINALLVKHAQAGKTVVRLKGGDPTLFGLLNEEIACLREHEISFEIIPGVTSGSAASAALGLSLTDRKIAPGATFVAGQLTAEKSDDDIDWRNLAQSQNTLVVYMGVGRLLHIVDELLKQDKAAQTPVAIVEKATLPTQRMTVATLGTIAKIVEVQPVSAPAIVIVGDVVGRLQIIHEVGGSERLKDDHGR